MCSIAPCVASVFLLLAAPLSTARPCASRWGSGFKPFLLEVRLSGASVRYRRALVVALGNEATMPPELRGA